MLDLRKQPRYRAAQLYDGLYAQRRPLDALTSLPKHLRAELASRPSPRVRTASRNNTAIAGSRRSGCGAAHDGAQVETVLMRYKERATVCVSSQAGCAMGCTFCATGQAGFERHLSAAEIVEQVLRAQHASPQRVSNVVFMGMGEPLANVDAVLDACTRLHDDLGISARHLTVSTVGVVPGIERLTDFPLPVTLAVSLHAADDAHRDELVPLNRRYPIADVLDAARAYADRKGRRVTFEYACIAGVNDTPGAGRAARGPAQRVSGRRAREPHSAERDRGLLGPREPPRRHRGVRGAAPGAGRGRQHPPQPRGRYRRGVRATSGPNRGGYCDHLRNPREWNRERHSLGQSPPAPDPLHGCHPLLHRRRLRAVVSSAA